jgi:hypothetical protein
LSHDSVPEPCRFVTARRVRRASVPAVPPGLGELRPATPRRARGARPAPARGRRAS